MKEKYMTRLSNVDMWNTGHLSEWNTPVTNPTHSQWIDVQPIDVNLQQLFTLHNKLTEHSNDAELVNYLMFNKNTIVNYFAMLMKDNPVWSTDGKVVAYQQTPGIVVLATPILNLTVTENDIMFNLVNHVTQDIFDDKVVFNSILSILDLIRDMSNEFCKYIASNRESIEPSQSDTTTRLIEEFDLNTKAKQIIDNLHISSFSRF